MTQQCQYCEADFSSKSRAAKFCSHRCYQAERRRRLGIPPLNSEPVIDGMKRCTKCHELRPLADFPIRIDRNRQPRSHCTPCGTAAARTPEARAKAREARYRRKYGISVADFEAMLEDQHGRCAICPTQLRPENWHVDHNHETGKVRGVLCDLCNKGLGQFKDQAELLIAAAAYLVRSEDEQ